MTATFVIRASLSGMDPVTAENISAVTGKAAIEAGLLRQMCRDSVRYGRQETRKLPIMPIAEWSKRWQW